MPGPVAEIGAPAGAELQKPPDTGDKKGPASQDQKKRGGLFHNAVSKAGEVAGRGFAWVLGKEGPPPKTAVGELSSGGSPIEPSAAAEAPKVAEGLKALKNDENDPRTQIREETGTAVPESFADLADKVKSGPLEDRLGAVSEAATDKAKSELSSSDPAITAEVKKIRQEVEERAGLKSALDKMGYPATDIDDPAVQQEYAAIVQRNRELPAGVAPSDPEATLHHMLSVRDRDSDFRIGVDDKKPVDEGDARVGPNHRAEADARIAKRRQELADSLSEAGLAGVAKNPAVQDAYEPIVDQNQKREKAGREPRDVRRALRWELQQRGIQAEIPDEPQEPIVEHGPSDRVTPPAEIPSLVVPAEQADPTVTVVDTPAPEASFDEDPERDKIVDGSAIPTPEEPSPRPDDGHVPEEPEAMPTDEMVAEARKSDEPASVREDLDATDSVGEAEASAVAAGNDGEEEPADARITGLVDALRNDADISQGGYTVEELEEAEEILKREAAEQSPAQGTQALAIPERPGAMARVGESSVGGQQRAPGFDTDQLDAVVAANEDARRQRAQQPTGPQESPLVIPGKFKVIGSERIPEEPGSGASDEEETTALAVPEAAASDVAEVSSNGEEMGRPEGPTKEEYEANLQREPIDGADVVTPEEPSPRPEDGYVPEEPEELPDENLNDEARRSDAAEADASDVPVDVPEESSWATWSRVLADQRTAASLGATAEVAPPTPEPSPTTVRPRRGIIPNSWRNAGRAIAQRLRPASPAPVKDVAPPQITDAERASLTPGLGNENVPVSRDGTAHLVNVGLVDPTLISANRGESSGPQGDRSAIIREAIAGNSEDISEDPDKDKIVDGANEVAHEPMPERPEDGHVPEEPEALPTDAMVAEARRGDEPGADDVNIINGSTDVPNEPMPVRENEDIPDAVVDAEAAEDAVDHVPQPVLPRPIAATPIVSAPTEPLDVSVGVAVPVSENRLQAMRRRTQVLRDAEDANPQTPDVLIPNRGLVAGDSPEAIAYTNARQTEQARVGSADVLPQTPGTGESSAVAEEPDDVNITDGSADVPHEPMPVRENEDIPDAVVDAEAEAADAEPPAAVEEPDEVRVTDGSADVPHEPMPERPDDGDVPTDAVVDAEAAADAPVSVAAGRRRISPAPTESLDASVGVAASVVEPTPAALVAGRGARVRNLVGGVRNGVRTRYNQAVDAVKRRVRPAAAPMAEPVASDSTLAESQAESSQRREVAAAVSAAREANAGVQDTVTRTRPSKIDLEEQADTPVVESAVSSSRSATTDNGRAAVRQVVGAVEGLKDRMGRRIQNAAAPVAVATPDSVDADVSVEPVVASAPATEPKPSIKPFTPPPVFPGFTVDQSGARVDAAAPEPAAPVEPTATDSSDTVDASVSVATPAKSRRGLPTLASVKQAGAKAGNYVKGKLSRAPAPVSTPEPVVATPRPKQYDAQGNLIRQAADLNVPGQRAYEGYRQDSGYAQGGLRNESNQSEQTVATRNFENAERLRGEQMKAQLEAKRVRDMLQKKGISAELANEPAYQEAFQQLEAENIQLKADGRREVGINGAAITSRAEQIQKKQAESQAAAAEQKVVDEAKQKEQDVVTHDALAKDPRIAPFLKEPTGAADTRQAIDTRQKSEAEQSAEEAKWDLFVQENAARLESGEIPRSVIKDTDALDAALKRKAEKEAQVAKPKAKGKPRAPRATSRKSGAAEVAATVEPQGEVVGAQNPGYNKIVNEIGVAIRPGDTVADVRDRVNRMLAGTDQWVQTTENDQYIQGAIDQAAKGREGSPQKAPVPAVEAAPGSVPEAGTPEAKIASLEAQVASLQAEIAELKAARAGAGEASSEASTVAETAPSAAESAAPVVEAPSPSETDVVKMWERLPAEQKALMKQLMGLLEKKSGETEAEHYTKTQIFIVLAIKLLMGLGEEVGSGVKEAILSGKK